MRTKYAVAALVAVILATATLAAATSYTSQCVNNSDIDIEIKISILPGVIKVLAHTVKSILYVVSDLLGLVLKLTWTIKYVVGGVLKSIDIDVGVGAKVEITELLDVLVNGVKVAKLL